jgi:hypothetical protein
MCYSSDTIMLNFSPIRNKLGGSWNINLFLGGEQKCIIFHAALLPPLLFFFYEDAA